MAGRPGGRRGDVPRRAEVPRQHIRDVTGALREYRLIQEHYAPEPDSIPYGFDLRETFPIATHLGSAYVVACGEHTLPSPHAHPVVGVFQGVDLYFHSIETMLETCVEWVRHPEWDDDLDDDIAQEIWKRRNPDAFDCWGQGS